MSDSTGSPRPLVPFPSPSKTPPRQFPTGLPMWMNRILGLDRIARLYARARVSGDAAALVAAVLGELRVQLDYAQREAERIPRSGPVLVVANHPFGDLDALALASLLPAVRSDVKIMANHLLRGFDELADLCLFVDPFGTPDAAARNIGALRQALGCLRQGRLLGVFPAGAVAHWQLSRFRVTDPAWSPNIAGLVRRTRASVVPIAFAGDNGAWFQLCGLLHPRLRTALLPRQLLNKAGKTVTIRIGFPISWERLARFESDRVRSEYLRWRTYALLAQCRDRVLPRLPISRKPSNQAPRLLLGSIARSRLEADLAALPAAHTLLLMFYSTC